MNIQHHSRYWGVWPDRCLDPLPLFYLFADKHIMEAQYKLFLLVIVVFQPFTQIIEKKYRILQFPPQNESFPFTNHYLLYQLLNDLKNKTVEYNLIYVLSCVYILFFQNGSCGMFDLGQTSNLTNFFVRSQLVKKN